MRREGYHAPTLEDLIPKVEHVEIPDEEEDSIGSLAEAEKETGMKLSTFERREGTSFNE